MLYKYWKQTMFCDTNLPMRVNVQRRMCNFCLKKSFMSKVDHMDFTTSFPWQRNKKVIL